MTTITLDAVSSGSPAPYIDILVSGFAGDVSTVTVWRTAAGRTFKVRGLVKVSALGTVTRRDFEAPQGVESSYRVEQFDSSGDFISFSLPEVATLDDSELAWIHNPVDPSTSVSVEMLRPAASSLVRPLDAEVFRVVGRSVGVVLFGTRQGLSNVQLDCLVRSEADADRFDALFGAYDDDATVPILCVRPPSTMRLPATLFALVSTPEQVPINFRAAGTLTRFTMSADEVSPPPEAVVTSLLGYDDFTAFYADYAAFTAAYSDYEAATRDYSIAGTA
jgi:hypothetical protein